MCVPLPVIRECWPTPTWWSAQQNLEGVRGIIMRHIDEFVTHQLLLTAWDSFAFPAAKEEHWKEDCLSYYLGKVVDIGAWMPGIRLVVQNVEGHYGNSMHVLLYEGHMLIYDPARNFPEWVPMRGVSSSLTSVELRSANDLNNICPCPHSGGEPPRAQSPKLVHSRPAGDETDSDRSHPQTQRSGNEPKHGNWSCCPTLPVKERA